MSPPSRERSHAAHRVLHVLRHLAVPALLLHGAGCGGADTSSSSGVGPVPEQTLSCSDLDLGDIASGGTFRCIACSRQWQWKLEQPAPSLYFLVEVECLATTGARLSLLGPQGTLAWETEVSTGDRRRLCIPHTPAPAGTYRLRLEGPTAGQGIVSFSGSVWASVYNHRGDRIPAAHDRYP